MFLLGKTVRFRQLVPGRYRVAALKFDGMIEIEGLRGDHAPEFVRGLRGKHDRARELLEKLSLKDGDIVFYDISAIRT